MGLRYRKRKTILPGVTLNFGRRGASASVGPRGARVNVGRRGATATFSLLGTGLSYVWKVGRRR